MRADICEQFFGKSIYCKRVLYHIGSALEFCPFAFLDVSDVVYTNKFIKTLALLRVAKGAHMILLILKIEENKIAHLVFLSALGRGKDC
jgi:hypothetical protein